MEEKKKLFKKVRTFLKKKKNWKGCIFIRFSTLRIFHESGIKTKGGRVCLSLVGTEPAKFLLHYLAMENIHTFHIPKPPSDPLMNG